MFISSYVFAFVEGGANGLQVVVDFLVSLEHWRGGSQFHNFHSRTAQD